MTTAFPAALDAFSNPGGGDLLSSGVPHHSQHDNANDALAALERVGVGPIWYPTKGYGLAVNGTTDDSAALAALNTTAAGNTIRATAGTSRLAGTLTLTTALQMPPGARFTLDSGKTLTINGPLQAGRYQIFGGAGTVVLGPGVCACVYPHWWGWSPAASAATNTAALAAMYACLAASGQAYLVDFGEGTYAFNGPVAVPNAVRHIGHGQGGTILNNLANDDAFQIVGTGGAPKQGVKFSDLTVTSTLALGSRTAGYGFHWENCGPNCALVDVQIENHYRGSNIGTGACVVYERVYDFNFVNCDIYVSGGGAASPHDFNCTNCVGQSNNATGYGIYVTDVSGLYVTGYNYTASSVAGGGPFGIALAPGAGQAIRWAWFTDCLGDDAATSGIALIPSGGAIESAHFVHCWACSAGFDGLVVNDGPAGSIIDEVVFTGLRALHNARHGISLVHDAGSVKHLVLDGCTVGGNSTASSGAADGLNVGAGFSGWTVRGGVYGTTQQGYSTDNQQRYGINVAAAGSADWAVYEADVRGNLTAGFNDASGASTSPWQKIIRGCRGYNPFGVVGGGPQPTGTGVAVVNPYSIDCDVYVVGGAVSSITRGGTSIGTPTMVHLQAGESMTPNYTSIPTLVWVGQ